MLPADGVASESVAPASGRDPPRDGELHTRVADDGLELGDRHGLEGPHDWEEFVVEPGVHA